MKVLKNTAFAALAASALLAAVPAQADDIEQVGRAAYLEAVTGKKVIFVPLSQGMDLNQAWTAVWQRHAARYGFSFEVRDPNIALYELKVIAACGR